MPSVCGTEHYREARRAAVATRHNLQLAANLLYERKSEFHPHSAPHRSVESGRQSCSFVQNRKRITGRRRTLNLDGDVALRVFHRIGDQLVDDKAERRSEDRQYLDFITLDCN